jgi:hypothetical protein
MARRFLCYLQKSGLNVHTVTPSDLRKYLRRVKRLRRSSRRTDLSDGQRDMHHTALRMLLRLVHGKWPPDPVPQTDRERFHRKVIEGYNAWMHDLRGLHITTRARRCASTSSGKCFRMLTQVITHAFARFGRGESPLDHLTTFIRRFVPGSRFCLQRAEVAHTAITQALS